MEIRWKKLGTGLFMGLVFSLIGFLLTGDTMSMLLGLLVFYLEVRRE